MTLDADFGPIDIYLFDQILRGRIRADDRIVDAGCGFGRNLVYFLRQGWDVYGIDHDPDAIAETRQLAASLAPGLSSDRFRAEPLEQSTFPDGFGTVVLSSAVLHFAGDDQAFERMLRGTWRLVAPGGLFFCRLASTIGVEAQVRALGPGERRYRLPDGTDRYLVDEPLLMDWTGRLGGQLLDPLKTTVVQNQRAMTTWVVRRSDNPERRGVVGRELRGEPSTPGRQAMPTSGPIRLTSEARPAPA
jgi:SAM-dependent methyltransferase